MNIKIGLVLSLTTLCAFASGCASTSTGTGAARLAAARPGFAEQAAEPSAIPADEQGLTYYRGDTRAESSRYAAAPVPFDGESRVGAPYRKEGKTFTRGIAQ